MMNRLTLFSLCCGIFCGTLNMWYSVRLTIDNTEALAWFVEGNGTINVTTSRHPQVDHEHRTKRTRLNPTTLDKLVEYRRSRIKNFHSWYEGNTTRTLLPNADENGTILDFAIIGFPKCGTTTIEANLGHVAPLPIGDICTPVHQTVYYAYQNWPKRFGSDKTTLRGTKCPAFIDGDWLKEWSMHLPKTKLILGIRHPVLWFQSFWNMLAANGITKFAHDNPYYITKPCDNINGAFCRNDCPSNQILCVQRASFHANGETRKNPAHF